ncbi:MAG: glutaredoxin family protein [Thermodesulfovibrionales bacterium]|nr:glutaredoxin family protein [Thermodesulfovibrionales bacterium]
MALIKLYTKPGCWLCDAADEMLRGQLEKYPIEVERVDITTDDELYELYRFDIPVIEFPDGTTLHSSIKKKALLAKLDSLTGS